MFKTHNYYMDLNTNLYVIKFSISLTNFPLLIDVIQKLWEISKKIDDMILDH